MHMRPLCTIPPKIKNKKIKNPPIKIARAHIHIPRNNPAKFHKYPMESLGGVAYKRPLYICISKKWFGVNPTQMNKSQIEIPCAHIPILRNNPAKFHNNQKDS